ncbi:MAG: SPOR domain-containing protein [Burkholderiales bacterium]
MGLLSIFKRARQDGAPAESASRGSTNTTHAPSVHQARTRARRRLIGASLLVLMGIVAFPILFESQPRPIPVDIPIEIPRAEGAPPLRIPPAVSSAPAPAPSVPAARSQVVVVEPAVPAGVAAPKPESAETAAAAAAKVAADKEKADKEKADKLEKAKEAAAQKAAAEAAAKKSAAEAARAKAVLEGKEVKAAADGQPKTAATAGRFVVQVGAYADADTVKDVRQKVEKLGLKTYTQVVDTSAGNRTRVRVGPLESKEQAEKVLERLKAAGLSAVVLTL